MDFLPYIVAALVALIAGASGGFFIGIGYRKKIAESEIGSAESQAQKILDDAEKDAENRRKESLIEAKDEIYKLRNEAEKEIKDRRGELSRQERRILQKEESLDKKLDSLEQKDDAVNKKMKTAEEKIKEADELKKRQFEILERISGFTEAQAREHIIQMLENELTHEKAVKISAYEQQLKNECDQKAREYVALAIQRCAAEQVSEITVSVVNLPSDEMKGRIIGREGRNIRTIETLTGVDLIIDDTPEAITLSCHDPFRREVARLALEKLIHDGRIHPTRIEEMVEKCRKETEQKTRQAGEKAVMELGLHGVHQEIVNILGRLNYRTSFCQNVLDHSREVAYIAGMLAAELGVNVTLAKRAGLLHDIGKAVTHETEGSHVDIGIDLAKKYKESPDVIHAIEAHHGDVDPKTIIACIVQAADAISAARPGARRENIDNFIKRLERLEEISNSFEGVEKSFAIQAGREVRVVVKPEAINDDQMVVLAKNITKNIEEELNYPGQVKVHIIRESRVIEYAK